MGNYVLEIKQITPDGTSEKYEYHSRHQNPAVARRYAKNQMLDGFRVVRSPLPGTVQWVILVYSEPVDGGDGKYHEMKDDGGVVQLFDHQGDAWEYADDYLIPSDAKFKIHRRRVA